MVSRLASSFSVIFGPFQAVISLAHLGLLWPLLSGSVLPLKFLPETWAAGFTKTKSCLKSFVYGNKVTELDRHFKISLKKISVAKKYI